MVISWLLRMKVVGVGEGFGAADRGKREINRDSDYGCCDDGVVVVTVVIAMKDVILDERSAQE